MDCIFCAIGAGDIPSHKLYEDDQTLVFLDIAPLTHGHCLVIPKVHGQRLADLDPADAEAMMIAAQMVRPAVAAVTGTKDATLAIHDGPLAGQEVPHVHLHIVPRTGNDNGAPVHALFKDRPEPSDTELADMAHDIRRALA